MAPVLNHVLNHLLSSILVVPLSGALVLLVASGRRPGAIRGIACGFAAATWALSLPLWFLYDPHGKTWQFAERGPWMPSVGASYYVGADGFTVVLILLTTTVGLAATLAAWRADGARARAIHILVLVMQAALAGASMALDFLLFFLCWTAALAAAYVLIRVPAGDAGRPAARAFAACALAAGAFVLAGVLMLYFGQAAGLRSFDVALLHTVNTPPAVQVRAFAAMVLGFALSVPIVPFHRWLRGAYEALPAAASVPVAIGSSSLAVYGILRFVLPIVPDASRDLAPAIAALALAAAVYAAALAVVQRDRTRRAAWASSSLAGLALAGAFAIAFDGSWARGGTVYPAPLRHLETAVARVVGRVHPELAPGLPRGSDCATPAPPEPAGPPPGFVLTAPCADGSAAAPTPAPARPARPARQ